MKANRPASAPAPKHAPRLPRTRRSRRQRLAIHGMASAAILLLAGSCAGPLIPPGSAPPASAPATPRQRPPRHTPPPHQAPPAPAPTLSYRPATPTTGWRDMAISPGEWRWSSEGGQSLARFGQPGATVLALSCRRDSANAVITITRFAVDTPAAVSPSPVIAVTTAALARRLTAQFQPGTASRTPSATVALSPRDPLLDAMAFSRGRFAVEVPGLPPLAVPSWPEVARVIDDCR